MSFYRYFIFLTVVASCAFATPEIKILTHSPSINKGGSALVIFKASGNPIKELYIETSSKKQFQVAPFVKEGYFIGLIAWPFKVNSFEAHIIAIDDKGERSQRMIPFVVKNRRYRVQRIKFAKRLKQNVAQFSENFEELQKLSHATLQLQKMATVMKSRDDQRISKVTSEVLEHQIDRFEISPFWPVKDVKIVDTFGSKVYFYGNNRRLAHYNHLGIDFVAAKGADIKASVAGKVVFAEFNGLYGNQLILSHGLGIYTAYANCSKLLVKKDSEVKKGDIVAKVGQSGFAAFPHLHFSVHVQGVAVRPREWMDRHWIEKNIYAVMERAQKELK